MTILPFLALTFGISLAGFLCIAFIPGAQSPETATGLPFWLVTVWGPSLAALILSFRHGELIELLGRAVKVSTVPVEVWLLVAGPLILLAIMKPFAPADTYSISMGMIVAMVTFNLVLGPLGEELGWRGVMQEQLNQRLGWLEASLLIGVVWLIWHLPLWTIDSPHSQISLHLFAVHCLLYSVMIGAAYTLSGGSILPSILMHLTFNLASNGAVFAGYREPNDWFSASVLPYLALSILAIAVVYIKTGQIGIRWISSLI